MKTSTRTLHVLSAVLFSVLTVWWIYLHNFAEMTETNTELFSASYGLMALFGAITGLRVSKQWGGVKSLIGKAIMLFSLGLFAQEFGQISYSLYTLWFNTEIPYPSVGDIGYFGSVILYAFGVITLGKALAIKFNFKTYTKNLLAILVPAAILSLSYIEFLKGYELSETPLLVVGLDFGYPLGQAFYLSLAVLVFILSAKYLGGVMRPLILALLFALGVQYAADFMFLFQTKNETWTTAGANDYVYLVSYFVMTTVLIRFKAINDKLTHGSSKATESE